MSENLLIAILGVTGAIVAGLIGAFGVIQASEIKVRQGNVAAGGCGLIGLVASAMAAVGLVAGVFLGSSVVRNLGTTPVPTSLAQPNSTQGTIEFTPTSLILQPSVTEARQQATLQPAAIEPTRAFLPTIPPTQTIPPTRFRTVSLQDIGVRECGNLGIPCGTQNLADVDFEIGWLATTQSQGDPNNPKTIAVNAPPQASNFSKIHFLLQASWGMGPRDEFGSIVLIFAGGRTVTVPLRVGYNIRDWSDVNRPLTSPDARQAWQGVGWDGRTKGVVDVITINVPSELWRTPLTRIEVRDESSEKLNSTDPGIHLWAITVE